MTTLRFYLTLLVTCCCLVTLWGVGHVVAHSLASTYTGTVAKVTADESYVEVAGVPGVEGDHIVVLTGIDRNGRELKTEVPILGQERARR